MRGLGETIEAASLTKSSLALVLDRLIRQPNGDWYAHVRVVGDAALPDGREVVFNRRLSARAAEQIGRKPRRAAV